jgi:mRNA-degrading endonuclease toxin of MazEF toxin-antitoxin module
MSEPNKPRPRLVFSDDERRQIVRNFVEAYIANEIQIDWPSERHFQELAKKGITSGAFTPRQLELYSKQQLNRYIMQATGYTEATYDEVEEAFKEIFDFILSNRMGERIKGSFFKGAITERRMKDLEDKVASHERLIQELRALGHVEENNDENLPQV